MDYSSPWFIKVEIAAKKKWRINNLFQSSEVCFQARKTLSAIIYWKMGARATAFVVTKFDYEE